jgi:hypothetical protein
VASGCAGVGVREKEARVRGQSGNAVDCKSIEVGSTPTLTWEEEGKGEMQKGREERIERGDRNERRRVHDGRGWVQFTLTNPRAVGRRWRDVVKTRKPVKMKETKGRKKREKK